MAESVAHGQVPASGSGDPGSRAGLSHRRWPIAARSGVPWILAAAALLVVAAGVTFVLVDDDSPGDVTTAASAQQLSSLRQACEGWLDAYGPQGPGPGQAWCEDMTDWMNEQVRDGRGMGPMMMWGSPSAMRDACRQWTTTERAPDPGDPAGWCDAMVGWMESHMSGGWMTNGPMMGGRLR